MLFRVATGSLIGGTIPLVIISGSWLAGEHAAAGQMALVIGFVVAVACIIISCFALVFEIGLRFLPVCAGAFTSACAGIAIAALFADLPLILEGVSLTLLIASFAGLVTLAVAIVLERFSEAGGELPGSERVAIFVACLWVPGAFVSLVFYLVGASVRAFRTYEVGREIENRERAGDWQ